MDRAIWSEFGGERDRVAALAMTIRGGLDELPVVQAESEIDEPEFSEGRVVKRGHLVGWSTGRLNEHMD